MTEIWQQQRFFQGIVQALQTAPSPLLLHLDDMQWSDAETALVGTDVGERQHLGRGWCR